MAMTERQALRNLVGWFDTHGNPTGLASLTGRVEDAKEALGYPTTTPGDISESTRLTLSNMSHPTLIVTCSCGAAMSLRDVREHSNDTHNALKLFTKAHNDCCTVLDKSTN